MLFSENDLGENLDKEGPKIKIQRRRSSIAIMMFDSNFFDSNTTNFVPKTILKSPDRNSPNKEIRTRLKRVYFKVEFFVVICYIFPFNSALMQIGFLRQKQGTEKQWWKFQPHESNSAFIQVFYFQDYCNAFKT